MTDEKVKFLMRIDPDTDRKIKAAMPRAKAGSSEGGVSHENTPASLVGLGIDL